MVNCFVSLVARQMTSNTVVAKRDVCKCVLLASQFKIDRVAVGESVVLFYSLPGRSAFRMLST